MFSPMTETHYSSQRTLGSICNRCSRQRPACSVRQLSISPTAGIYVVVEDRQRPCKALFHVSVESGWSTATSVQQPWAQTWCSGVGGGAEPPAGTLGPEL